MAKPARSKQREKMNQAKLILFTNTTTGQEYVVIFTGGEETDFQEPGYTIAQEVEIGSAEEFTIFPCDRTLRPE